MNRELTTLEIWLVIALLLCGVVLFSGCTTARQHMYMGQLADAGTTYYALNIKDGYREANPLADDVVGVIAIKAVFVCFVELFAYLFPNQANTFYGIGAASGYAPAVWNILEMNQ